MIIYTPKHSRSFFIEVGISPADVEAAAYTTTYKGGSGFALDLRIEPDESEAGYTYKFEPPLNPNATTPGTVPAAILDELVISVRTHLEMVETNLSMGWQLPEAGYAVVQNADQWNVDIEIEDAALEAAAADLSIGARRRVTLRNV